MKFFYVRLIHTAASLPLEWLPAYIPLYAVKPIGSRSWKIRVRVLPLPQLIDTPAFALPPRSPNYYFGTNYTKMISYHFVPE